MACEAFKDELFTNFTHYEESTLRERKRDLPNLLHNECRAEFLRDVIALANAARMRGKPAYLLFGIDNEGAVCGVDDSLGPFWARSCAQIRPEDSDPERREEHLWREVIGRCFLDAIERHISLDLAARCELCRGKVGGNLCAYLCIPPMSTPDLFSVRRALRSGRQCLLAQGESWIRIGESKRKVQPGEDEWCYAFTQAPYPLPLEWRKCFQSIADEWDSLQVMGYQDLYSSEGTTLDRIVAEFLRDDRSNLLIVQGKAGVGKSLFLKRLVQRLAKEGLHETEQLLVAQSFDPPRAFIPLYVPLRGWESDKRRTLASRVMDRFNSRTGLWNERPKCPELMLEYPKYRWLLCFDGLDEIWSQNGQRSFVSALRSFRDRYMRVKVIVSTRPDVTMAGLDEARLIRVAPLTPEQIEGYLGAHASDQQLNEIIEFLQSEPDLWSLCGMPAFLEAAAEASMDEYKAPPLEMETQPVSADSSTEQSGELPMPTLQAGASMGDLTKLEQLSNTARQMYEERACLDEAHSVGALDSDLEAYNSDNILGEPEAPVLPIHLGKVLDNIYQRIWQREKERRLVNIHDYDRWWGGTARLAAQLDGTADDESWKKVRSHMGKAEGVYAVLSCGILERGRYDDYLRFTTALAKTYFAARYVLPFLEPGGLQRMADCIRCGKRAFWERVIDIVRDLTYTDLTPLENLVSELPNN